MGYKRKAVKAVARGAGRFARGGLLAAGLSYGVERQLRAQRQLKGVRTTPRRALRPPKRAAVKSMPVNRIGKSQGLIHSNQKCPMPKTGSVQYRRSNFGVVESLNKVWVGASSVCQLQTHFKTVAHAILAYYLPKMGDYRATNDSVESTGTPVFHGLRVTYGQENPPDHASFPGFVVGDIILNQSYTDMAAELGLQLLYEGRRALTPVTIEFIRDSSATSGNELRDTNLGRHVITVSVAGTFRFQNVTAASTGDGTTTSTNINAVDANPLNGKIYTFRNQAPLFSNNYQITLTDPDTRTGIETLQAVNEPYDVYAITASGNGGRGGAAFTHIEAPPLNPKSIWKNVSSTGQAVFPPGGFKTFKTSYLRSKSIAQYIRELVQVDMYSATGYTGQPGAFPPSGDSFMMCLRPTIKSTSEYIKLAYNTEYILKASVKRRKPSALQVVNQIQ